jgi:AcrR family transcriptional regulator
MAGDATTLQADSGQRRERILAAALTLFASRGYHATPVPDIAMDAGIATGTIYRYFATKELLLNAVFQAWQGRLNDCLAADLPEDVSARERFSTCWRRHIGWLRAHPVAALFLDSHAQLVELDAESRALALAYAVSLDAHLEAAMARGLVRALPVDLAVAMIRGAALGMARDSREGRIVLSDEMISTMEDMLWRAISA